jgi:hypothetical protein
VKPGFHPRLNSRGRYATEESAQRRSDGEEE